MALIQSTRGAATVVGSTVGLVSVTCGAAFFQTPTTAGNLIVITDWSVKVGTPGEQSLGTRPMTVAGTAFTTRSKAQIIDGSKSAYVEIQYVANAPSFATTAAFNLVAFVPAGITATSSAIEFNMYEFSGTTGDFDGLAQVSGAGTPHAAVVNSQTDFVVLTYVAPGSTATLAAGAGYTLGLDATAATMSQMEYEFGSPAGTVTAAFIGSINGATWGAVAMSFQQTVVATAFGYSAPTMII